jgi:hypothetical protein
MSSTGERPTQNLRQRGTLVIVGAAAGLAVLIQLAGAPSAQADDVITPVITAIDGTFADGQAEWSDAMTLLSSGDVPDGLAAAFTGLDDFSVVPQGELWEFGYDALQGSTGPYPIEYFTTLPAPTDLSTTAADVTDFLNNSQLAWSDAVDDFGLGHIAAGLGALADVNSDVVAASQVELIGLTDTLLGGL